MTMPEIQIPKIRFIDIAEREELARQQIQIDIDKLEGRKKKNGSLSVVDEEELRRLKGLNSAKEGQYLDPLFAATRAVFASEDAGLLPVLIGHDTGGQLEFDAVGSNSSNKASSNSSTPKASRETLVARVALVLGILQVNGAPVPQLVANSKGEVLPDEEHRNMPLFTEAIYRAIGRTSGNVELAKRVLGVIADAVDLAGDRQQPRVSSLEFARVVEKLIEQGVSASDPNLKRRVDESLDRVQETGDERPAHEIGINLPDLEATTDQLAVEGHIRLFGPMIFASMFDELKAFQVVDHLMTMSQRGEISLIRGKAGTRLYNYWRQAPNRMSEMERQTFYAMTLGIPTGPPGVAVNVEFQDLWVRFVSSVSALVRENRVDQLIRSALPVAINQQQVKKAARDLASNMSLYGYGMAYYAAIDLQTQINEMIELLQDPDLRAAFGARDMWGVIDQVAQVELGGARNSSKYRTLATCGAIVTTWLANNVDRLRDPTRPMIDLREVENPPARASGHTATSHPTDYDLVNACELWLADSAMAEDRVEELSQPRESPQQPSRPIQIPSIARDLLQGTGLGFEMGTAMGNGGGRPNGRANGRAGAYQGY
jgi:hypothetical protein